MKELYIIGAGGAAKEIYLLIKEINNKAPKYDFRAFVDVDTNGWLQIGDKKIPVVEESIFLRDYDQDVSIVVGLGNVNRLKKIIEKFKDKANFEFPNLIHPDVNLDESILLGEGNIITAQCVFTIDISVDSFNYFNRGVHLGHDCVIGSYNVINPCAVLSGGIRIGSENLIGTNATLLQYLKIGSKNKIGAGAVVTKNIEDNNCMIGVPAKNMLR